MTDPRRDRGPFRSVPEPLLRRLGLVLIVMVVPTLVLAAILHETVPGAWGKALALFFAVAALGKAVLGVHFRSNGRR